jgi:hypothetical protein
METIINTWKKIFTYGNCYLYLHLGYKGGAVIGIGSVYEKEACQVRKRRY